jgi:hypothetical protein
MKAGAISIKASYRFKKPDGSYEGGKGTIVIHPERREMESPRLGRVDGNDVRQIIWGELEFGGRMVEGLTRSYGVVIKGDRFDFGKITESRPTSLLTKLFASDMPPVEQSDAARLAQNLAIVCPNATVEKILCGHGVNTLWKWRLQGNSVVPLLVDPKHLLLTDRGFYFFNAGINGALTVHAQKELPFARVYAVQVQEQIFCNYIEEIQRWAQSKTGDLAALATKKIAEAFHLGKIFSGLQLIQMLESKLLGGDKAVVVYPTEGEPAVFLIDEEIDIAQRIAPCLQHQVMERKEENVVPGNIHSRLEELKRLFDDGLINENEYRQKKQEILSEL